MSATEEPKGDGAPSAAGAAVASPDGGSPWRWAGVVAAVAIAVAWILYVSGAFSPRGGPVAPEKLEPAVREAKGFLKATTDGDMPGAHRRLVAAFRSQWDLAKFKETVEKKPVLFQVSSVTFTAGAIESGRVKLRGTVESTSGKTLNCLFELIEEDGAWRIFHFNITDQPIPG